MSTVGRPQKEITPDEIAVWKIAGQRLYAWRKDRGLTQEKLGVEIGRSHVTIGRYERGEQSVPESVAKWLQHETGIFWRYWTGETDALSLQEFLAEERRALDAADYPDDDEYFKEQRARQSRLESLFFLCGYRYSSDPFYDLIESSDPLSPPPGTHKVTPYANPGESYSFTDGELEDLLKDFEALISLRWHRKVLARRRGLEK